MKHIRFVVIGSLLALLVFASGPLATPRVAAANGSGWPTCEYLRFFGGIYPGGGYVFDLKAGERVEVAGTATTSAPNQLMGLFVQDFVSGEIIFENIGPIPGSLAYVFPADGLYVVMWGAVSGAPTPPSWIVTAVCATAPVIPPGNPPAVFWPGDPDSPVYDGRINAEPADRYVVYCANSELQVWDGKNNIKMGTITFADISAMPDPSNQQIGDTVFLGRSNNILTVNIGPGAWIKDNIKLDKCVGGLYKKK